VSMANQHRGIIKKGNQMHFEHCLKSVTILCSSKVLGGRALVGKGPSNCF
jgi:hypothetical protein